MKNMILLAALTPILTACFGIVGSAVTETGVSIAEQRSFGSKVEDNVIYADISRLYLEKDVNDLLVNVTVDVHNQRVMLTGDVKTQETAENAVAIAWQAKNVKEVINELNVNPSGSLWDSAQDELIQTNLEARYLTTSGTWVINYSINVVRGTIYMLGVVHNRAELDKVLEIARTTKGAKKVVSHLRIATTTPDAPALPPSHYSSQPATNTTDSFGSPSYSEPVGTVPPDGGIQSKENF